MEDKALVENLKKKVSELTEAIKSGAADHEKANVMIEYVEFIVKAITVQLDYEDLGGEIIGELPSREELDVLNDLIGVTKNQIRITSKARSAKYQSLLPARREGNTFKTQHSEDDKKWKNLEGSSLLVDTTETCPAIAEIEMKDPVRIGMAVCSHAGPAVTAEAKISNVTVTGEVEPAGEFIWSEDIGFQAVALPKK